MSRQAPGLLSRRLPLSGPLGRTRGFTALESLVVLGVLAIMTILILGLIRLNLAPEKDFDSPEAPETGALPGNEPGPSFAEVSWPGFAGNRS